MTNNITSEYSVLIRRLKIINDIRKSNSPSEIFSIIINAQKDPLFDTTMIGEIIEAEEIRCNELKNINGKLLQQNTKKEEEVKKELQKVSNESALKEEEVKKELQKVSNESALKEEEVKKELQKVSNESALKEEKEMDIGYSNNKQVIIVGFIVIGAILLILYINNLIF